MPTYPTKPNSNSDQAIYTYINPKNIHVKACNCVGISKKESCHIGFAFVATLYDKINTHAKLKTSCTLYYSLNLLNN